MGEKLRKICLIIGLLMFMAIPVHAQDIITTPYGLSNLKGINLQADTLYLPATGNFAAGLGTNIATIIDVINIRGEFVVPVSGHTPDKVGGGVGVNIPKLVSKFGGSWLVSGVNANIGVEGLISLNGKAHLEPVIYMNVINLGL